MNKSKINKLIGEVMNWDDESNEVFGYFYLKAQDFDGMSDKWKNNFCFSFLDLKELLLFCKKSDHFDLLLKYKNENDKKNIEIAVEDILYCFWSIKRFFSMFFLDESVIRLSKYNSLIIRDFFFKNNKNRRNLIILKNLKPPKFNESDLRTLLEFSSLNISSKEKKDLKDGGSKWVDEIKHLNQIRNILAHPEERSIFEIRENKEYWELTKEYIKEGIIDANGNKNHYFEEFEKLLKKNKFNYFLKELMKYFGIWEIHEKWMKENRVEGELFLNKVYWWVE